MRVLVTTAPGFGHVFAPVALAWAFRAAGHDVLVATGGRPEAGIATATWAGLPVVEVAAAARLDNVRTRLRARRAEQAAREGISPQELATRMRRQARDAASIRSGNPFAFAAEIYGPFSAAMVDGLLALGRAWRPDLVVYEAMQGAGPLVAAALGVPAVEHLAGFSRGPELARALRDSLDGDYRRAGVTDAPPVSVALEVAPPSMGVNEPYGRPMRCVPFDGSVVLPDWLREPCRRVAVTFGSVVPHRLGLAPLQRVLPALTSAGVEVVVACGRLNAGALGPVPANVRVLEDYFPLTALLTGCTAVVHHGGPASTLASLDAGLPQLVLPDMADQFVNAEAVRRRGCGLVTGDGPLGPDTVERLFADPALSGAAAEVRAEMRSLPTPYDVVPDLVALTTERAGSRPGGPSDLGAGPPRPCAPSGSSGGEQWGEAD